MLDLEHDLGLNAFRRMLSRGFDKYGCNDLECMAYNVNLGFVLRLFERARLLSITENISYYRLKTCDFSHTRHMLERQKLNNF